MYRIEIFDRKGESPRLEEKLHSTLAKLLDDGQYHHNHSRAKCSNERTPTRTKQNVTIVESPPPLPSPYSNGNENTPNAGTERVDRIVCGNPHISHQQSGECTVLHDCTAPWL